MDTTTGIVTFARTGRTATAQVLKTGRKWVTYTCTTGNFADFRLPKGELSGQTVHGLVTFAPQQGEPVWSDGAIVGWK